MQTFKFNFKMGISIKGGILPLFHVHYGCDHICARDKNLKPTLFKSLSKELNVDERTARGGLTSGVAAPQVFKDLVRNINKARHSYDLSRTGQLSL